MISALLLEWIPDGGLPIYDLGQRGMQYYTFRQDHWTPTPVMRDGRAWVSIEVDYLFPDLQERIQGFLEALEGLTEAIGTLIFAIRSCGNLGLEGEGDRIVLAGMAFAPLRLPGATDLDGARAGDLITQFCGGIVGADSTGLHPAIRAAYERELVYRAEADARRQVDAEAVARSLELLKSHLSPEQLTEFQEKGVFHVQLRDGRLFRFSKGFGHNVHLLENGACVTQYCIIAVERVPLYDQILAQKVMLEVMTEEFFRIANYRHRPTPLETTPPPPPFAELANILAQV